VSAPGGALILLVDDFDDAREMYTESLIFYGYRVTSAGDAATAIEMAVEQQPDLILMDAALPGMSGWDATKALKADARTRNIPLLMLTGHVLTESKERAAHAGADGLIPKPCLPDELAREIEAILKHWPSRTAGMSVEHQRHKAREAAGETAERLAKGRAQQDTKRRLVRKRPL
jgi:two-component system cell cycle response regulator DivK